MRCRMLICFWLSHVVFMSSASGWLYHHHSQVFIFIVFLKSSSLSFSSSLHSHFIANNSSFMHLVKVECKCFGKTEWKCLVRLSESVLSRLSESVLVRQWKCVVKVEWKCLVKVEWKCLGKTEWKCLKLACYRSWQDWLYCGIMNKETVLTKRRRVTDF